jgi:hypothetical protein
MNERESTSKLQTKISLVMYNKPRRGNTGIMIQEATVCSFEWTGLRADQRGTQG